LSWLVIADEERTQAAVGDTVRDGPAATAAAVILSRGCTKLPPDKLGLFLLRRSKPKHTAVFLAQNQRTGCERLD